MGITISRTEVYAPIGDTVALVGTFPEHFDEQGNCDNGKNIQTQAPCSDYSFELMFDSTKTADRFYPIILRLSGSRQGITLDQSFVVPFEPGKFKYRAIEGLPAGIAEDG